MAVSPVKEAAKELVASTPSQRNWRGILIALLVIIAVCGLILCSIVLLMPPDDGPRFRGRKIELPDILMKDYAVPTFNGTWVSGTEFVYRDPSGGLSLFDAVKLKSRILMSNITFNILNAQKFMISADLKFVVLIHDMQKVYRHSFIAKYTVYEIATEYSFPLASEPVEEGHQPYLQMAAWSPEGNAIVFCYENDLYYKSSVKGNRMTRLTDTGKPGVVFNGITDWLYEEEILSSYEAVWFSPDGQTLLYATFDDSLVGELKFAWYGTVNQQLPYPEIHSLRYPKAGTANPIVTLWTVNLSDERPRPRDLKPPLGIKDQDHYFTAVKWISNKSAAVVWMNRRQNVSIVSVCSGVLWNCPEFYKHEESGGWVDMYDTPVFSEQEASCLVRLPQPHGNAGPYKHLTVVHRRDNERRSDDRKSDEPRVTPLTQGPFEVTEIVGWDESRNLVYIIATPLEKPGERHLYRVWDHRSDSPRHMECMTCPEVVENATKSSADAQAPGAKTCLYNMISFSPNFDYFIQDCRGPEVPSIHLYETRNATHLLLLQNNDELREEVDQLAVPQIRDIQVEVTNGYKAQVRILLPPGFREYDNMQFPLVLQVYAGPGSQLVSSKWRLDWSSYLASQRNFLVAQIDARGSGFQGDGMMHAVYRKLGTVEVEDQIAIVQYLRNTLEYVDRENIGVWGWSYGGYVAAMILVDDKDKIFKCGISVAPVTNWALYDTAYTERYMGLPNVTDNYRGYEDADITRRAGNMRDRPFLLIHGTADDNVHYQQSLMLARALVQEGVIFRHQTYPDENHSLGGVKSHLYKAMEAFLDDCFDPMDFEEWELASMFNLRH